MNFQSSYLNVIASQKEPADHKEWFHGNYYGSAPHQITPMEM
jgi:hypothetical protein